VGCPDFALSSYEFDVLWDFDRMPYPLAVPRIGRTPAERAVLVGEVRRALLDRGLVTEAHEVDPRLAALLRLLGQYRVAVDLVADIGYPVRALAATDGRAGVLAVLAGGELWLTGIAPADLVSAIVGVLPGGLSPGSVPYQRTTVLGDDAVAVVLGRDAVVLSRLPAICRAAGRFGVSTGGWGPLPDTVTWLDTETGPYLVANEGARLSIGPTGHADIARRITDLLSTVEEWSTETAGN
jgi:hypothetical protein